MHLASSVEVGQLRPRPVDEELLAGLVVAAHDDVDALLPGAVTLAEPGVAVAFGVHGAVLAPDQAQGDVLAGKLCVHARPVGLAGVGYRLVVLAVEAFLELCVADALGQRPGQADQLTAGEDSRDGRVRDADRAGDGAPREPGLVLEPQDLPDPSHGQSPVGHRALLVVWSRRVWRPSPCAASTCRRSLPLAASKLFGFERNRCSACSGIGVRLAVESVFGLPWNRCSASSGIRSLPKFKRRDLLGGLIHEYYPVAA